MIRPVNAELREIAGFAATGGAGWQVAAKLTALADRGDVVVLPGIDPARDDLRHWRELEPHNLAAEVAADAMNLAAGVHVARTAALAAVPEQSRWTDLWGAPHPSLWSAVRADVRHLLGRP